MDEQIPEPAAGREPTSGEASAQEANSQEANSQEANSVLRALWSPDEATEAALELDESTPAKVCKRMRGVTFDDMAEPGTDLQESWRRLLRREGKYADSGETLADLVLGPAAGPDRR